MKTIFLVGVAIAAVWGLFLRHDQMRPACFDEGRVVGGAEQRIFAAKSDGYDPLPTDITAATKGASKDCR